MLRSAHKVEHTDFRLGRLVERANLSLSIFALALNSTDFSCGQNINVPLIAAIKLVEYV